MKSTISESRIESVVCQHAKKLGWLVYKFTSPGHRGVPDRVFFRNGETVFIEFKRKGGKLTALQASCLVKLKNQKFTCLVIDDIDKGKEFFDTYNLLENSE